MSDERFENTNASRGMNETDKGYYEDLYTDLPKEVVDILMQTHPLMGKNEDDAEAGAYRTRRPQRREDVEEVREARMQQVSYEINEVSRAPQQEGDPTRYVSRRARHTGIVSEELPEAAPRAMAMNDEEYDDGIQYVSVMPPKRKSRIGEEVTLQTSAPAKRGRKAKKEREEVPFQDMGRDPRDNRPRYEDVDFEERVKQEHLDSLYDDDYDDDDFGGKGKLAIILGIVGLILIIFLIFRTVSLGSKLEDAQNQLTQSQDYKEKYEEIQLEKMQLEEQLDAIMIHELGCQKADELAKIARKKRVKKTTAFIIILSIFGPQKLIALLIDCATKSIFSSSVISIELSFSISTNLYLGLLFLKI